MNSACFLRDFTANGNHDTEKRRLFNWWYFCTRSHGAAMKRGLVEAVLGILAFLPVIMAAQTPSVSHARRFPASPVGPQRSFAVIRSGIAVISAVNSARPTITERNEAAGTSALLGNSLEVDGASDIPVAYAPGQSAEITLYSSGGLEQKLYDAFNNPGATGSQDFGFAIRVAGAKLRFMMGSGDVQLSSPKLMAMGKAAALSEAAWSIVSPGGHFGFRIQGRMLVDPSPAKYYPIASTVNFYYVGKPAFSAFYRF
jgi:hypothetical protein